MTRWWWADCKSCGHELRVRPSMSTSEKLDLGGLGPNIKNPVVCFYCGSKNRFGYGDLYEAVSKDSPRSVRIIANH
jgi:hypothetical protein